MVELNLGLFLANVIFISGFPLYKVTTTKKNSCVCFYGPVFHAIFAVFYLPSQLSFFILKQKTNFMC